MRWNKKKIIWPLTIAVFFVVIGFSIDQKMGENPLGNISGIRIAGQDIKVELAITDEKRQKGLSGREYLAPGEGLFFIFERPNIYTFWMKEMFFPIDIIWLAPPEQGFASSDKELEVVYIKKNAQPESFPEMFTPSKKAKYVLEVPAGFSDTYNLKVGDKATVY